MSISDDVMRLKVLKTIEPYIKALGGLKKDEVIKLNFREKVKLPNKKVFETDCMEVYKNRKTWLIKVKDLPILAGDYLEYDYPEEKIKGIANLLCEDVVNKVYNRIIEFSNEAKLLEVIKLPEIFIKKTKRLLIYNGVLYGVTAGKDISEAEVIDKSYAILKLKDEKFKDMPNVEFKDIKEIVGGMLFYDKSKKMFYNKFDKPLLVKEIENFDEVSSIVNIECGDKLFEITDNLVLENIRKANLKTMSVFVDCNNDVVGVSKNKRVMKIYKNSVLCKEKGVCEIGAVEIWKNNKINLKKIIGFNKKDCVKVEYENGVEIYAINALYKRGDNFIKRFIVEKEKLKDDCNYLTGEIKLHKKMSKKDILVFNYDKELSKFILKKGNSLGEVVGEFILDKQNSNIKNADEVKLFGIYYENIKNEIEKGKLSFYLCGSLLYIIDSNSILVSIVQ